MKLKSKLFLNEFRILFLDLYLLFAITSILSTVTIFSFSVAFSFKKNAFREISKVDFRVANEVFKYNNNKKEELLKLNKSYNSLFFITNLWNYTFGPKDYHDASPSIYKNEKYYYLSENYYKTENNDFISEDEYMNGSYGSANLISVQGALFNYNLYFYNYFKTDSSLDYIYINPYIFKIASLKENERVDVKINNEIKSYTAKKLIHYKDYAFVLPLNAIKGDIDEDSFINFYLFDLDKYNLFCNEFSLIYGQQISNDMFDNIIRINNITKIFLITTAIITLILIFSIVARISHKIIEKRQKNLAIKVLLGQSKLIALTDILLAQLVSTVYSFICSILLLDIIVTQFKNIILGALKINYTVSYIVPIACLIFGLILIINIFVSFIYVERFNKTKLLKIYRR